MPVIENGKETPDVSVTEKAMETITPKPSDEASFFMKLLAKLKKFFSKCPCTNRLETLDEVDLSIYYLKPAEKTTQPAKEDLQSKEPEDNSLLVEGQSKNLKDMEEIREGSILNSNEAGAGNRDDVQQQISPRSHGSGVQDNTNQILKDISEKPETLDEEKNEGKLNEEAGRFEKIEDEVIQQ